MNPWRFLFACLAAALLATARAAEPPVVTATGHPNWPPFSWQQDGHFAGAGPELLTLIAKEMGLQVQFQAMGNWKRAQAEVEAGKVDVLVACYRTEARTSYLAYPATPFADDANVLWVARGHAFPFKRWEDLEGRTGTAMAGDSFGQSFDDFIARKLKVERVNTPEQNLQKLVIGRADYYVFSLYGGQIQVNQFGYNQKVEHLPNIVSTEGVYIGISKRSALAHRAAEVEAIIARLRADGTLEHLIRKHIALAARH